MNSKSVYIGNDKNNVPVMLYSDDGYINDRVELSIDSKTWKVYFYGVNIGVIDEEGAIDLYDEESNS